MKNIQKVHKHALKLNLMRFKSIKTYGIN